MTTTTDRIVFYRTHWTKEPRAFCTCCATVLVWFDDDDLTDHASACTCTNTNHQHETSNR